MTTLNCYLIEGDSLVRVLQVRVAEISCCCSDFMVLILTPQDPEAVNIATQ